MFCKVSGAIQIDAYEFYLVVARRMMEPTQGQRASAKDSSRTVEPGEACGGKPMLTASRHSLFSEANDDTSRRLGDVSNCVCV